jgi:hypothetical protein
MTTSPVDRDVLLARLVDGEARAADWDAFRTLAAREPAVWADLHELQAQHAALCGAVSLATRAAERIPLPIDRGALVDTRRFERRMDTFARWGGWAAAAAVLGVLITGQVRTGQHPPRQPGKTSVPSNQASLVPAAMTPDAALQNYIQRGGEDGRVIAEMPDRVVLETRPLPDGRVEVLYLRQILERQLVDRVVREAADEIGRPVEVPVPVRPTPRGAF